MDRTFSLVSARNITGMFSIVPEIDGHIRAIFVVAIGTLASELTGLLIIVPFIELKTSASGFNDVILHLLIS